MVELLGLQAAQPVRGQHIGRANPMLKLLQLIAADRKFCALMFEPVSNWRNGLRRLPFGKWSDHPLPG